MGSEITLEESNTTNKENTEAGNNQEEQNVGIEAVQNDNKYDIEEGLKEAKFNRLNVKISSNIVISLAIAGSLAGAGIIAFSSLTPIYVIAGVITIVCAGILITVLVACNSNLFRNSKASKEDEAYLNVLKAKREYCVEKERICVHPYNTTTDHPEVDKAMEVYKAERCKSLAHTRTLCFVSKLWVACTALCVALSRIDIMVHVLMFTVAQFVWMAGTAICVLGYVASRCLNGNISQLNEDPGLSSALDKKCSKLLGKDIRKQLPHKFEGNEFAKKDINERFPYKIPIPVDRDYSFIFDSLNGAVDCLNKVVQGKTDPTEGLQNSELGTEDLQNSELKVIMP